MIFLYGYVYVRTHKNTYILNKKCVGCPASLIEKCWCCCLNYVASCHIIIMLKNIIIKNIVQKKKQSTYIDQKGFNHIKYVLCRYLSSSVFMNNKLFGLRLIIMCTTGSFLYETNHKRLLKLLFLYAFNFQYLHNLKL